MVAKRADRDAAEQILQMHLLRPDIMTILVIERELNIRHSA